MSKKIQFHTLDALRFFAFLMVYFLHVPIQGEFPVFNFLKSNGSIGVIFFFTLSGFLITYILVHEKINVGQINLGKFFMRRSFRIWPLYMLMVVLAFVMPYNFYDKIGMHMVGGGYMPDWRFSFSFLENYKMLITDNFPRTTPLSVFWSLCIEEHFYLLWMVTLFFIPVKRMKYFFTATILIGIISRIVEMKFSTNTMISSNDILTNLDLFSIGALLGLAVAKNYEAVSKRINSIAVWIKGGFIIITLCFVVFHETIMPWSFALNRVISQTIYGLLFTGVIAIFIPKHSVLKIGDNNILSRLGKISYGLYIYHIICNHVLFQYFLKHNIVIDNWKVLGAFMAITFFSTVVISILSFQYFEKPFLRMREKLRFRLI